MQVIMMPNTNKVLYRDCLRIQLYAKIVSASIQPPCLTMFCGSRQHITQAVCTSVHSTKFIELACIPTHQGWLVFDKSAMLL